MRSAPPADTDDKGLHDPDLARGNRALRSDVSFPNGGPHSASRIHFHLNTFQYSQVISVHPM